MRTKQDVGSVWFWGEVPVRVLGTVNSGPPPNTPGHVTGPEALMVVPLEDAEGNPAENAQSSEVMPDELTGKVPKDRMEEIDGICRYIKELDDFDFPGHNQNLLEALGEYESELYEDLGAFLFQEDGADETVLEDRSDTILSAWRNGNNTAEDLANCFLESNGWFR